MLFVAFQLFVQSSGFSYFNRSLLHFVQAEKKDTVGVQEQAFVRKVIELHDKYLQYVSECFVNHSLFHKVSYSSFSILR